MYYAPSALGLAGWSPATKLVGGKTIEGSHRLTPVYGGIWRNKRELSGALCCGRLGSQKRWEEKRQVVSATLSLVQISFIHSGIGSHCDYLEP